MIELLFLASNFQCGANAPMAEFVVEIKSGDTTKQLSVNQRLVMEKEDLELISVKPLNNADCISVYDSVEVTVDSLPTQAGLYNQPSVLSYQEQLKDSESIYLYEFGATSGPSADYQDAVLKIDWDYQNDTLLYAD